jgi:hypothetical protein
MTNISISFIFELLGIQHSNSLCLLGQSMSAMKCRLYIIIYGSYHSKFEIFRIAHVQNEHDSWPWQLPTASRTAVKNTLNLHFICNHKIHSRWRLNEYHCIEFYICHETPFRKMASFMNYFILFCILDVPSQETSGSEKSSCSTSTVHQLNKYQKILNTAQEEDGSVTWLPLQTG